MSVRDVFRTDLALLHAPSVYDFRTSVIMHGPIADAVPSTNEFEMYPVGLTSIASYLSANHYNVRIINLAYLMLARRDFDVEAYVARLHPKMFGIDLHWLPHAQGALAIAEMVKRHHPEIPVLMGGCRPATTTKNSLPTPSSTMCCVVTRPRNRAGNCSLPCAVTCQSPGWRT